MRYHSTRNKKEFYSFQEVLLSGLANDGGLFMPESYPQICSEEMSKLRHLSYADLAYHLLSQFMTDIPKEDLNAICHRVYQKETFSYARNAQKAIDVTPVTSLSNNIHLLELSNGPTLAFKDMAMQLLGHLFQYSLDQQGKKLTLLGATSGDTGSAAEYAARGLDRIKIFMLSPQGRMSAFQRAQMYSLQENNIFNLAIEGNFDQCQDIVKAITSDLLFKEKHQIGTVNSINWARIAAQIVYYFKAYFSVTESNTEKVSFCVPTGNFGNICAGFIASKMGLPIQKLVLATNENDVLDDFFRTGLYQPRNAQNTYTTSSPSMDISKASNFERFMFEMCDRNPEKLTFIWQQLETTGSFNLNELDKDLKKNVSNSLLVSGRSTHQNRIKTIQETMKTDRILIDPHTADALFVAYQNHQLSTPMVVLETAQPAKFSETIKEALGQPPPLPSGLEQLENKPQKFIKLTCDAKEVKEFIQNNF